MSRSSPKQRAGLTMAVVLACLAVVLLLGVTLTQLVVMQHRCSDQWEAQLQCSWLADAALQRAVRAAAASSDYAGENWQIPASELGGVYGGRAEIEVQRIAEPKLGLQVRVMARYPDRPTRFQTSSREAFVNSPGPGGSP